MGDVDCDGARVYFVTVKKTCPIFPFGDAACVSGRVLEDLLHCQKTTPSNRFPVSIYFFQLQS